MKYRCFPWLVGAKTTDGVTLNDEIAIKIRLFQSDSILQNKFHPEKIMKASML